MASNFPPNLYMHPKSVLSCVCCQKVWLVMITKQLSLLQRVLSYPLPKHLLLPGKTTGALMWVIDYICYVL